MRALILSDIHGSAIAARQALSFFEKFSCDRIFLLGDTLYHGPRNPLPAGHGPMGVVEALAPYKECITAVRGNCDAEIDQVMLDFPCMADYAWLVDGENQLYCTHGHLWDPDDLPKLPAGCSFVYGHFHVKRDETVGSVHLFNPGSVGLPKDGSHSVGIYEDGAFSFRLLDRDA